MATAVDYRWLPAEATAHHGPELAALLHACVHGGASVGFILPHTRQDSLAFWQDQVFPEVKAGARLLLTAEADGRVVGTVQLICWMFPNQAHRAEVSKLLVDPDYRKRGIARTLMSRLELKARQQRRSLLTLDTISGSAAEQLYLSLGFQKAGEIPGFARAPLENRLEPTTYLYKTLSV